MTDNAHKYAHSYASVPIYTDFLLQPSLTDHCVNDKCYFKIIYMLYTWTNNKLQLPKYQCIQLYFKIDPAKKNVANSAILSLYAWNNAAENSNQIRYAFSIYLQKSTSLMNLSLKYFNI